MDKFCMKSFLDESPNCIMHGIMSIKHLNICLVPYNLQLDQVTHDARSCFTLTAGVDNPDNNITNLVHLGCYIMNGPKKNSFIDEG